MLALGVSLGPTSLSADPQQPRTAQQSPQQQPQRQSPGGSAPEKPSAPASGFDDRVIERVRRQLRFASGLAIPDASPKRDVPVYRVEVSAHGFRLPDWRDRMPSAPAVPQPFGGADYYEMMRLITPPEFWGSAGMTNREVLDLLVTSAETWAARKAAKKAINAYQNASKNRLHKEVQRELAEVAAHNARVAAGQGDGAADAKAAADKKKPAEVKKKK